MTPIDPITEADFDAYVDDQLPVERRIEVEAYLARTPAAAARVMADLRARDELRLALSDMPRVADITTAAAARKLETAIASQHRAPRLARVAVLALCLAGGWFAHAHFGTLAINSVNASTRAPAYVGDALQAYRAQRHHQPSSPAGDAAYDPEKLRAATAIVLPKLPMGWTVQQAKVLPATFGPSVELDIRASKLGDLALFAVRPGTFDVIPATAIRDGEAAAYWQIGETAYVLIADTDAKDLEHAAARLAQTLY
ncbi:anti-sigma factor family protein [Rhodoligotrophos defluvii]|uniref:anti-sigma factor family protein n=1 Tax=Rhodoligotrophos defluvii TaxID=2561934 RepID=UPI0010C9F3C4|nr:anti-sigma factor [Rhodoligotrophos defluvii]